MNELETRLTAALSDTARRNLSDVHSPPPFHPAVGAAPTPARSRRPRGRRLVPGGGRGLVPVGGRWLVPAAAAAVVVALAVGALLGVNRLHHAGSLRPASTSVQVTFHTVGDAVLTQNQLRITEQTVLARLSAAGITGVSVRSQGADRLTLSGPLTAAQRRQLPGLMAAGALQFRALLAEPADVTVGPPLAGGGARAVDPLHRLGFAPPTDSAALAALTPARRQAVLHVLQKTDCQVFPTDTADSPIVACSADGRTSYLLGPAIVAAGQVKAAAAIGPGTVAGQLSWIINVELTPPAQQSWAEFTSTHNIMVTPDSTENQVADVVDGKVIVVSTIQSTITGTTQITGDFTQDSASTLATALAGPPLPVSFVE